MQNNDRFRHFADPLACLLNPLHPDSILAVSGIVLTVVLMHAMQVL